MKILTKTCKKQVNSKFKTNKTQQQTIKQKMTKMAEKWQIIVSDLMLKTRCNNRSNGTYISLHGTITRNNDLPTPRQ